MTRLNCSQCHTALSCNVNDINACWCNQLPAILPLEESATSCLCPQCTLNKINAYLAHIYTQPIKAQIEFAKAQVVNISVNSPKSFSNPDLTIKPNKIRGIIHGNTF